MKTPIRSAALPLLLAAAVTTLGACGGTLGGLPAGNLRVVNGISDSTSLDARAANLPSDINNITVNTASGFRTVPDSSFDLSVTVNTASGSQPAFKFMNVKIDRNVDSTAYLPGKISNNSFGSAAAFQVNNPNATITTGQVELQPVHASSAGPAAISIYITAPTVTTVAGLTPINLNYRQAGTPTQIAGGSYRIRVTVQGSPAVIFDSGATGVNLAAGQRLQLAALNETDTTKGSQIFILAIPSDGSAPLAIHNGP
ncbi:MAG: hypothetical protein NVS9B10_03860 [Nevskia sp.]